MVAMIIGQNSKVDGENKAAKAALFEVAHSMMMRGKNQVPVERTWVEALTFCASLLRLALARRTSQTRCGSHDSLAHGAGGVLGQP